MEVVLAMNEWMLIGVWISLLLGLGGLVFPLVWRYLGQRLADGGFGVSVTAGIVLTGWITFMMASLRLAGFGFLSAAISLGLAGLGSGLILWKNRKDLARFIRQKRILLLIELGLLIFSVIGWSLVRGFQPDIAGLEKFMDAGFVNAILRSKWMPPTDMWLSGHTINYYYFGHFLTAFLTLLSGIDSAYTYNLMLATVFGLAMAGSFSFVFNFLAAIPSRLPRPTSPGLRGARNDSKIVVIALLTAILFNFGGNLHTAWHFLSGQEKSYWYPDATRFIPYTIHEFPMYSHTVADLHGHLIDAPIVLVFLTVLTSYLFSVAGSRLQVGQFSVDQFKTDRLKTGKLAMPAGRQETENGKRKTDNRLTGLIHYPIIFGFLLGIMSMTNTWDVPIYGLVFAAVATAAIYKTNKKWKDRCFGLAITGGTALAAMVLASFPFHLNFQNIVQGLAWVESRSPLWQLGVLWGGFGVIGAVAVWRFSDGPRFLLGKNLLVRPNPPISRSSGRERIVPKRPEVRQGGWLVSVLPLVMVGVSALLIVVPEFVYVKDIYIKEYHRANTMFKLTYQAFVMMSLVFGMTLGSLPGERPKAEGRRTKAVVVGVLLGVLLIVFSAHMAYPFLAIPSYYNGLKKFQGLYGLQWLARQYPNDHQLIEWMKRNIPWQLSNPPVILEAVGESYTDHGRVSAFTGLPTVLGWRVHEWLWRGSFDIPGQRTEEVKTMYEKPISPEAAKLFKQYKVQYIFVGDLERQDYKLNEPEIEKLGPKIFIFGSSYLVEYFNSRS